MPTMTQEHKEAFLKLLAEGSGRLEACQALGENGIDALELLATLASDKLFSESVELIERAAVDDAAFSAATSGNLPAILNYYKQHQPKEKDSPTGPFGEVRRLAQSFQPLLQPPDSV